MNKHWDVIVYGATPGGIGAAIGAARRGNKTLLIEPTRWVGGMMTSGLGRTDIDWLEASGAIYREFAGKVLNYYTNRYGADSEQVAACNGGMFFEPSLAAKLFHEMIENEPLLELKCLHSVMSAVVTDSRLTSIVVSSQEEETERQWSAAVFIDGTYEGDLAAMAGVPFETGRESRDQWNEEYAGVLYMNFDETKEVLPGSTGEGDERIQAYNYRLCLTKVPTNRAAVVQPPVYRREDYISLAGDVAAGRIRSIRDVLNILPVPGGKTDANNHHYCMCSSDLPEGNEGYIEGDRQVREDIIIRHKHYIQGLLWFLQQDESLPNSFREEASEWGYAADEFVDTDNFPPQLYVREGRRIHGEYVFTENDARLAPGLERSPIHYDSIAVGAYAIDSHAVRKREPAGQNVALEGFLGLGWITEVYQIPYGVMIPRKVEGLLVPVAVSSTHMGLGTIRMEPCWMQLGFAAGVAADLAISKGTLLREVTVDVLQDELLKHNQLISFFRDIDPLTAEGKAIQYFGAKGVFTSYYAAPAEPISARLASSIIVLARSLPGGRGLPSLPASGNIMPAGVDMGPRFPKSEPSPEQYWADNPLLTRAIFVRWLDAVHRGTASGAASEDRSEISEALKQQEPSIGEFCQSVFRILNSRRSG
ncbi:FAD-dependent oxidoreductase [Paenibacillaceae bacterium]|nr:FAD-dependent oxidoreductase [Paenibacillaceae bacterium]